MKQNVIVFLLTIVNFLGIFVCIFIPFVLDPLEAIPMMAIIFLVDAIKLGNRKGHIMIRIIVSSKKTHEPMCYHNVKDMREADRMAEDYSQIKGIKVEVLLLAATDEQATALQRERGY